MALLCLTLLNFQVDATWQFVVALCAGSRAGSGVRGNNGLHPLHRVKPSVPLAKVSTPVAEGEKTVFGVAWNFCVGAILSVLGVLEAGT